MTNQEAFTLVVQHLRTQGIASMYKSSCRYRHPDGIRRCAIGVLIPDSEYTVALEGWCINRLSQRKLPCLEGLDLTLLDRLQMLHDYKATLPNPQWAQEMEQGYRRIAKDFHLNVPPHPCRDIESAPTLLTDSTKEVVYHEV